MYNMAEAANTLGKFEYAKGLYAEALKIRVAVYSDVNEDHPEIAESYFGVAENLRALGIYDVAKPTAGITGFGKQLNNGGVDNGFDKADEDVRSLDITSNGRSIADSILDGNEEPDAALTVALEDENRDDSVDAAEVHNRSDQVGSSFELIAQYKAALPLYDKVLTQLQTVESFDGDHPLILQVMHSIAETKRCLGLYEEASVVLEDVLVKRRKLLGDNHPDTVQAMFGMGEVLRSMGKYFADNPSGSVEAKEIKKAMSSVLSGVTLMDHFNSIVLPAQPLPSSAPRPETALSASGKSGSIKKGAEGKWKFISQPENVTKKVKTALKIPRGYMGYEFPKDKQLVRSDLPRGTAAATKAKKVNVGDAKLLYEGGLAAQKALYGANVEHPMTANLLFSKGELMRARRNNKEALQLYESALAMRRRLFRGTHPAIADCLNGMAEVFRLENKFAQAGPLFEKALEIRVQAYNGSHPCIAEVKNNIAMLQFGQVDDPTLTRPSCSVD